MNTVNDIPKTISEGEALELLGYCNGRKPEGKTLDTFEKEKEKVIGLANPRGVYEYFSPKSLPKNNLFNTARKVCFCVVTIGSKIESEVARLSRNGHMERSVILDALGSSATEQAANHINEVINDNAREMGFATSKRFSPGYCTWDIEGQRMIFEKLSTQKIGVSLTENLMMAPRKSISFAVCIGPLGELDASIGRKNCGTCDDAGCRFNKNNKEN